MIPIRVLLLASLAIVATKADVNCVHPCTREYKPVCAFDGTVLKTYDNKCLFDIANCESHYRMTILSQGKCPEQTKEDCNKMCTLDYNPVCGSDGHKSITYGNKCSFDIANCEANYKLRLTRNGECVNEEIISEEKTEADCVRPCPAIFLPVCGFDGENYQTFASECNYEVMNCLSNNHLRLVKMGEC